MLLTRGNSIIESQITLEEETNKEIDRCIDSAYYFYTNYLTFNNKKATTRLTEKEFNEYFKENRIDLIDIRKDRLPKI